MNPMMSIAIAAAVMMIAISILLVDRLFSGAFCSAFKNAAFSENLQLFSKDSFFYPVLKMTAVVFFALETGSL